MSHLPYRKEKNCLNCDTIVLGSFCQNCGQENIEPKESVWHLISHFFNDVTHFDGKFFSTIKILITKPGFLSSEYSKGRRTKYLNPIRMYIFTSAIFFFIFFSVYKGETVMNISNTGRSAKSDSIRYEVYKELPHKGPVLSKEEWLVKEKPKGITIAPGNYRSKEQYDSLLKAGIKKHNWFERHLVYKSIELNSKYHDDNKLFIKDMAAKFLHLLPQLFFVLLPLYALLLKIFYFRSKDFYYTDHVIFTIHFYIFLFLVMMFILFLKQLEIYTHFTPISYLSYLLQLYTFFYFYKSMRKFYLQRRGKTILKYFLILNCGLILTVTIFILFFFISVFEI